MSENNGWPLHRLNRMLPGEISRDGRQADKEEQVAESTRPSYSPRSRVAEFSSAMTGFEVIDRDGVRIGTVRDVSLGRTCILVESGRGSLFGRKRRHWRHGVHVWAVRAIDLDGFTISLAVATKDVAEAPEFAQLDPECETALARHYYDRLTARGESVDADA
jgi:hypothetical protein